MSASWQMARHPRSNSQICQARLSAHRRCGGTVRSMVILGIILLIIGLLVASLHVLFVIGIILLIVGLVLNLVPIGGSKRRVF